MQEGKTTTLEFRNEPDGIISIYKKDAVTGAALGGVQFTVTTGSGELVAIADGMISSNGVLYFLRSFLDGVSRRYLRRDTPYFLRFSGL